MIHFWFLMIKSINISINIGKPGLGMNFYAVNPLCLHLWLWFLGFLASCLSFCDFSFSEFKHVDGFHLIFIAWLVTLVIISGISVCIVCVFIGVSGIRAALLDLMLIKLQLRVLTDDTDAGKQFSDPHFKLVCQPAVTRRSVSPSVKNSINLSVERRRRKKAESNKS